MFKIIFYHSKNGKSEIIELLDNLNLKKGKNDRINREKILTYINILSQYGTKVGQPIVKHIENDIWELRPLNNRIFFFYWKDNKFVLLHHFVKKTKKTPIKEIEKARLNLKDFLERSKNNEY